MAPWTSAHYRTRDAAMLDDTRRHGDDQRRDRDRDRDRGGDDDRGMTTLQRPKSPVAAAAAAAVAVPSSAPAPLANRPHPESRGSRNDSNRNDKPRLLSRVNATQPGPRRRRRSRDRSRDRSGRPSQPPLSRPREISRERDRDRERGRPTQPRDVGSSRGPSDDAQQSHRHNLPESRSPAAPKRRRSPSPSLSSSLPKRSKRDRSPRRPAKDQSEPGPGGASPRQSAPPAQRPLSVDRRGRHPKERNRPGPAKSPGPSRRQRSRSPRRDAGPPRALKPLPDVRPPQNRGRSRSPPPPISRRRSVSRNRSPHTRSGARPPTSSDTASRERPTPDTDSRRLSESFPPPRSPRDRRGPRSGKKERNRDKSRFSKNPQPASGANSVEVNMAARGGFRGGYNAQMQSSYSGKGQYAQGSPMNDQRGFSHSSGHVTPNSSFHGSPSAQSPFNGGGRGWGGQQQFSPHHGQYPTQYPQGGSGFPPTGPGGQYHNNQGHSPPPYGPPTGPAQQYPPSGPAAYRGGFRGGRGFRGNHFSPGRGGHQGINFKNNQWVANGQGGGGRGQPTPINKADDTATSSTTPQEAPNNSEDGTMGDEVATIDAETPFGSSNDLQIEDKNKPQRPEDGQMPPPSRPPPTGPQASKFSFAFKAPSKPALTPPKPDISSKFNAAPQRRDVHATDDRDRGGLPKSVPTEPASVRARAAEQRQHVDNTPRVRKVKKMMRRPKPKPTLPPDLAASDSVFFRKPGNESVIGSGTYGKVFKGLNVYTKKLVALKKIRMEGERDGFPVTAVREIKLLQSLQHTNIVNLQEVMVEKNDCFMVFEYLSHDLTGLLNHPSFKLDDAQKKHLSKQLFEGLDYLHSRGVLHRDIKAANILVSSDGILKLADFGLARFYAKRHQLDYTNRVITIWYRSPELLLGETQYGPAVDIWSAACVLVEIFTRHAIFPGDGGEISQLEKIYAVLGTPNKNEWPNLVEMPWFELLRPGYRKPNVFADKYREKLTGAAFDLLVDMFQYDPAKRPTAAEILEYPYFTVEEPAPRQATELQNLDGDWHEFESKALRREKERQEKEARRAAAKEAAASGSSRSDKDKERKRPNETAEAQPQRDSKRMHVDSHARASHSHQRQERVLGSAAATSVAPSQA